MVEDDGIVYKKYKNQAGISQKMPMDYILSLQYEDGTTENLSVFQIQAEEANLADNSKSDVNHSNLSVRNGHIYNSNGEELSSNEIEMLFKTNSKTYIAWEKSNAQRRKNVAMRISTPVFIGSSVPLIVTGLLFLSGSNIHGGSDHYYWYAKRERNKKIGIGLTVTGGVFLTTGIVTLVHITITRSKQNMYMEEAVNFYNASLRSKNNVSLNFGLTHSGNVGFVLNF